MFFMVILCSECACNIATEDREVVGSHGKRHTPVKNTDFMTPDEKYTIFYCFIFQPNLRVVEVAP